MAHCKATIGLLSGRSFRPERKPQKADLLPGVGLFVWLLVHPPTQSGQRSGNASSAQMQAVRKLVLRVAPNTLLLVGGLYAVARINKFGKCSASLHSCNEGRGSVA